MVRWGAPALAALLVLGVAIAGVLYAFGQFGQSSQRATDGGVGAPARALITNCRPCRDEALAAQQPGQPLIGPASATAPIASHPQIQKRSPRMKITKRHHGWTALVVLLALWLSSSLAFGQPQPPGP